MTREQQVALDAMRSAWPEEVVQRMLRAEDGRIEEVLIEYSAVVCRCGSRDEDGAPFFEDRECPACLQLVELGATLTADYATFSPPETPAATSTHRPQEEPTCCRCGGPDTPLPCGCD